MSEPVLKQPVLELPVLELTGVSKVFGGVNAVDNVTLEVAKGQIVGLIGPNGAGKTTLVNLVSGMLPATGGTIVFNGRDITRERPHVIARMGIARTFQIVQPFAQMTVLENVMAGALYAGGQLTLKAAADKAMAALEFTKLAGFADKPAADLALANRKRLELAKSLAMDPQVLMLDEVNAGLNSSEIDEALALIRTIASRGLTIIVIEHLMRVVASLAERIVVLHHGALLADGAPDTVFNDQKVIEAYLGTKFAKRHALQNSVAPVPANPTG